KQVIDSMVHDGLTCSFENVHMGTYGSSSAAKFDLTREQQDEWSFQSHQKALKAIEDGKFAEEIVPVEVPQRRGEPVVVEHDESPRSDTSLEQLGRLRPAFDKDGTITAGNAPGINDGAAAFVLMSDKKAAELGKTPL